MKIQDLYELTELPDYYEYLGIGKSKNPTPGTPPYAWSGSGPYAWPPAIGSTVVVRINGIGRAKVLNYFVEAGFLGLWVKPTNPPAWFRKQNKDSEWGLTCGVFGAELSPAGEAVA